jgi:predicted dinucleotide-binding enzyme
MKFGTIGAGAVALAFGREALARGHEVVLSSRRGPDALVALSATSVSKWCWSKSDAVLMYA